MKFDLIIPKEYVVDRYDDGTCVTHNEEGMEVHHPPSSERPYIRRMTLITHHGPLYQREETHFEGPLYPYEGSYMLELTSHDNPRKPRKIFE